MGYKVLFIDLDGTLTETISGSTFPKGSWDMKLNFDVLDAIRELHPDKVFIITNQGGIESGFVTEDSIKRKLAYVLDCIMDYCQVKLCGSGYCKTNSKDDPLRKPNVGLFEYFLSNFGFDKSECLMVGDASGLPGQFSDSDRKAAENFGISYLDVSDFVRIYSE